MRNLLVTVNGTDQSRLPVFEKELGVILPIVALPTNESTERRLVQAGTVTLKADDV